MSAPYGSATAAGRLRLGAALSMVAVSCVGCISFSSMQTARTLRQGKTDFTVSGGYETMQVNVPGRSADGNSTVSTPTQLHLPVVEYGFRYGIHDGFDLGVRTSILGSSLVDGKFRILDTGRYALSGGFGLGYSQLNVGTFGYETKVITEEVHVPVYNSFVVSPGVELFLTPRYVYRQIATVGGDSLIGAAAGIILGRGVAFAAEASYFQDSLTGTPVQQVMVGVIFGEDNTTPAEKKDRKKKDKEKDKEKLPSTAPEHPGPS